MPFNPEFSARIRSFFTQKNISFTEKTMFSGICFMVDDKMCCGTHADKKTGEDLLMCRIGAAQVNASLKDDDCIPMEFTGRPMKDYLYVLQAGTDTDNKLAQWLQKCLDFNPIAKKSSKKK